MSNDFDFNLDANDTPSDLEPAPVETEDDGKGKKKKAKKTKAKKEKPKREKAKKEKRPKRAKRSSPAASVGPKIPQFNVYTSMLLVALICLSIASLMLYLELNTYGSFPQWKTE